MRNYSYFKLSTTNTCVCKSQRCENSCSNFDEYKTYNHKSGPVVDPKKHFGLRNSQIFEIDELFFMHPKISQNFQRGRNLKFSKLMILFCLFSSPKIQGRMPFCTFSSIEREEEFPLPLWFCY